MSRRCQFTDWSNAHWLWNSLLHWSLIIMFNCEKKMEEWMLNKQMNLQWDQATQGGRPVLCLLFGPAEQNKIYCWLKPDAHKAWVLVFIYPTFGPLSPLVPLTPAFPRLPWGQVCHVFQWGNRKKKCTWGMTSCLCMNLYVQWLLEMAVSISAFIPCTHTTTSAWKLIFSRLKALFHHQVSVTNKDYDW